MKRFRVPSGLSFRLSATFSSSAVLPTLAFICMPSFVSQEKSVPPESACSVCFAPSETVIVIVPSPLATLSLASFSREVS